ncbi:Taste receptor type 2 member 40 [Manis javanica]|nr:Taste receptor type 2 member 40 [Manis javanica]
MMKVKSQILARGIGLALIVSNFNEFFNNSTMTTPPNIRARSGLLCYASSSSHSASNVLLPQPQEEIQFTDDTLNAYGNSSTPIPSSNTTEEYFPETSVVNLVLLYDLRIFIPLIMLSMLSPC